MNRADFISCQIIAREIFFSSKKFPALEKIKTLDSNVIAAIISRKIIRQKFFQKALDSALRSDLTLNITIRIGTIEEWMLC